MGRLQGCVALVTGAGHGIGKAYAARLAEEGARVAIAELDGEAAETVRRELESRGGDALAVQTDIADTASVDCMVGHVVARFGRIDVLVNNAAMYATVPMSRSVFDSIPPEEWDQMMRVNLKGTWLVCRAVIPHMRRQGGGKIINISSATALSGAPTRIHYVTSKAGLIGFTKTLARELGPDNICVNCVAPGSTLIEENPDEVTLKRRQGLAAERAIRRIQLPEDLTGAIVFFASRDSDFITGQTLVVDGGAVMH